MMMTMMMTTMNNDDDIKVEGKKNVKIATKESVMMLKAATQVILVHMAVATTKADVPQEVKSNTDFGFTAIFR
jgi:hypothetical protein